MQDDAGNFILTAVEDRVELDVARTEQGLQLTWTDGGPWFSMGARSSPWPLQTCSI